MDYLKYKIKKRVLFFMLNINSLEIIDTKLIIKSLNFLLFHKEMTVTFIAEKSTH